MNLLAALLLVFKHAFPANPRSNPEMSGVSPFLIMIFLVIPKNPLTVWPGALNNEMGRNDVREFLRMAENIASDF